jgi:hypothetical protein|tara:strand:+ start:543 stop:1943 length:1401 start_codon:yes stop_codon:yes gene_type:complete
MAYNVNQNWSNQIGGNMFGFGNPPNQGIASVKVPQDAQRYFSGDAEIFQPGANWQNELAGYGSTMDRRNIDNTLLSNIKGKVGNVKDTVGFKFPSIFATMAAGVDATNPDAFNYNPRLQEQINFMKSPEAAKLGLSYGVMDQSGLNRITGGALAGKNLQSAFGSNDLTSMYEKELARAQGVLENLPNQWSKLAASTDEADIARWKEKQLFHRNKVAQIKKEQAAAAAAAQAAADERIAIESQRASTAPQRRAGRGGTHMSRSRDQGGLGISQAQAQSISDANRAAGMSGWGLAQGGRAGYQGGELVGQETDFIEGPQGGEEFQETVVEGQEQPSREQLEALAMHIFQLPLEELDDQQLVVVYQAAMQGQPMEEAVQEDVQFAAGGGRAGYLFGDRVEQQTDFLEEPGDDLMASDPGLFDSRNELSLQLFGKELHLLTEEEMEILNDEADRLTSKFMGAEGGLASLL